MLGWGWGWGWGVFFSSTILILQGLDLRFPTTRCICRAGGGGQASAGRRVTRLGLARRRGRAPAQPVRTSPRRRSRRARFAPRRSGPAGRSAPAPRHAGRERQDGGVAAGALGAQQVISCQPAGLPTGTGPKEDAAQAWATRRPWSRGRRPQARPPQCLPACAQALPPCLRPAPPLFSPWWQTRTGHTE